MGRNISDVIERVVAELPAGHADLRRRLIRLSQDVWFTPPESMGVRWRQLCDMLTDELPTTPAEPWQQRISRIVRGEE